MCKVNEKTYIYPNGDERLVETVSYCSKSEGRKVLCNSYERIPQGPFFVHDSEPSLVHDGFGTPASSAGQPSTPTSTAGMDYRSPGSVSRRPSSSKRAIDASKLKISFRRGGSRHDSHHSRHASASSSSGVSAEYASHTRQPSSPVVPASPRAAEIPERVPSGETSPSSPHEGRRRRFRAVVDHDPQPNPPPGTSSSGNSSLSGRASLGSERPEGRMSDSDRRRAQDLSDQQGRHQRREERARAAERSAEEREASDREARERALDEQSRREWERANAREAIRAEKAARRAEEERANTNQERRYTMPDRERRSSAAGFVDELRRSMYAHDATTEPVDDAETQRRHSTLQEQLRTARAARESTSRSNSDNSVPGASTGVNYGHAPPPPATSARSPTTGTHRSPPIAYETRMPSYTGYASDNTDSTTRHSWTRPDVSARHPMPTAPQVPQRRSSTSHRTRRPSSSGGQRPASGVYGMPPAAGSGTEVLRPGSSRGSSHNNAAWTHDRTEFRNRGEHVLERARARAAQASRAQEASFRMTDAMYDDGAGEFEYGAGYEGYGYGYPPEEYYRRGF